MYPVNCVFVFLSAVPLLSRGWIVPVGGSTPDRHKAGTRPTGTGAERSIPAECLPVISNSEDVVRLIVFLFFCPLFLCSRVGGSFRSGVQPPTGSRPAQDRHKDDRNWIGVGLAPVGKGCKKKCNNLSVGAIMTAFRHNFLRSQT